jgi:IS5 family transposase
MIRYQSQNQMSIEEFRTPFEIKLSRENRWVKLGASLPWDALVNIYCKTLSENKGRPVVDPRIVIGALIIKHKEGFSDERAIEEIQENVYQQYFLGLKQYQYEPVFDASLFVTIRKRIGDAAFDAMVEELIRVASVRTQTPRKEEHSDPPNHSSSNDSQRQDEVPRVAQSSETDSEVASTNAEEQQSEEKPNEGTLIVDMTVAPADIAYPTDIELLNTAREKTEELIDVLYKSLPEGQEDVKPRTYRRRARREYLSFVKKRKKSLKSIRKALRKQLGYVGRNIKTIHRLLDRNAGGLQYNEMRMFWIIQELYRQQREMYESKTNRISDRLVSVWQPHVRPIVRGKASASTEFGAQVSVSVMNGYRRIHRIAWDPYHESSDLEEQLEHYKSTYGCYPEVVLADKKYGTRTNRELMAERGIRYGGVPLGRPKKDGTRDDKLPKDILNQRNQIEGTFGTGKRAYGLNRIKARRSDTSMSWIAAIFFVMNLPLFLRSLAGSFLSFFDLVLLRFFMLDRRLRTESRKSIFVRL